MDELHRYLQSLGFQLIEPKQVVSPKESPPRASLPNSIALTYRGRSVYLLQEQIPFDGCLPRGIPLEIKKWLRYTPLENCLSIEDFLFLDIETSGMVGGAGTICFLVGIGRISSDQVTLLQYLLLHPEDEIAQLFELEKLFHSVHGVVSYNGKSFDLPLLQSRFQFHQLPISIKGLLHLDLLHLARKLWRNRSPNRALRTLEANIIGVERSITDIPGWMIPSLYRDFLLTQDTSFLSPILYHNRMDVTSLIDLYFHIVKLLTQKISPREENVEEMLQLANFYQSIGDVEGALQTYLTCYPFATEDNQRIALLESTAMLYKKQKEYEKAIEAWQEAAYLGSLSAHLELAKVYEHRKKDLDQALQWVESARQWLANDQIDRFMRAKWEGELKYRLERLTSKKELVRNERNKK